MLDFKSRPVEDQGEANVRRLDIGGCQAITFHQTAALAVECFDGLSLNQPCGQSAAVPPNAIHERFPAKLRDSGLVLINETNESFDGYAANLF